MANPSVNLTRLSLSGKTIATLVALATIVILLVGLLLMVFEPSVRGFGERLGSSLKRQVDRVTPNQGQPETAPQSATAGMA